MWPEKITYYGEFIVYPLLIAGLATAALWQAPPERSIAWLAAFVAGLGLWTLVEYILHRYVLHHMPYIKEMHQAHHDEQGALLRSAILRSLGSFAVFLVLPAWFVIGPIATAGLTAGMMLGYVCFEGVHHILHHWRILPGSYFYTVKHRHALHHFRQDEGNFGVTTLFWDHVFGTALTSPAKTRPRPQA